jgi:hypothetical protein
MESEGAGKGKVMSKVKGSTAQVSQTRQLRSLEAVDLGTGEDLYRESVRLPWMEEK